MNLIHLLYSHLQDACLKTKDGVSIQHLLVPVEALRWGTWDISALGSYLS